VNWKSTVFEKSSEPFALVASVANAVGDRRVIEDDGRLGVAPREEATDNRCGALLADLLLLLARRIREGALDAEERADETESDFGALGIGREGLEEVPAAMSPAVDLGE
jgi:hypothetical protein